MHFSTVLNVVLQFKQISKLHFQTEAFVRFRQYAFYVNGRHTSNEIHCIFRQ